MNAIPLLLFLAASSDPAFDVASVKPVPPPAVAGQVYTMRSSGGPGTSEPERLTTSNMSLKLLLSKAFNIRDYQIQGPGWLESEHYDIVAKVPPGATREQFYLMYQNLLIERFKMAVRHGVKEQPVMLLTVARGGPKLALPDDVGKPGLSIGFNGPLMRVKAKAVPISDLVSFLTSEYRRPVFDKTGITGKFDFEFEFAPRDPDAAQNLITALGQLGLKLETGKGPVDILIVEKAVKIPVEN